MVVYGLGKGDVLSWIKVSVLKATNSEAVGSAELVHVGIVGDEAEAFCA